MLTKRFHVKDLVKSIRSFNNGKCTVNVFESGTIVNIDTEYTTIQMNNGNEVIFKNDLVKNFFVKKQGEMEL